jgi:hypothetical protein
MDLSILQSKGGWQTPNSWLSLHNFQAIMKTVPKLYSHMHGKQAFNLKKIPDQTCRNYGNELPAKYQRNTVDIATSSMEYNVACYYINGYLYLT